MKNKKSNQSKRPIGIYGGEVNGANPIDWTLRSTIAAQLRALGWHCSVDAFSDSSGSWIEVHKEDPNKTKEGKIKSFSIAFNCEGTIITNVRFFEQAVYLKVSDGDLIF